MPNWITWGTLAGRLSACIVALMVVAGARADDTPIIPGGTPPLRIAISQDSDPFYYIDADGMPVGWVVDMWRLWSARTGIAIEFKHATFGESLRMAQEGRVDVHAGLIRSRQRELLLDYLDPVCHFPTHLLFRRDFHPVRSPEVLGDVPVGVVDGDYALEFLRARVPDLVLNVYKDNAALFEGIAKGEVDIFVKDLPIARRWLERLGLSAHFAYDVERPLYTSFFHAAVPKGQTTWSKTISEGFSRLRVEEHRAIERRWLGATSLTEAGRLPVLTAQERAWLASHPTLRASVVRHRAPLQFVDTQGRFDGIAMDYLQLIGERLGLRIEPVEVPDLAVATKAIETGSLDLIPYISEGDQRAASMLYTGAYASFPRVVIMRENEPFLAGLAGLVHRRVAVVTDDPVSRLLRTVDIPIGEIPVPTLLDGLRAVSMGDADAIVANLSMAAYLIGQHQLPNLKVAGASSLPDEQVSMAVSHDQRILATVLQKAMETISGEDRRAIETRWVSLRFDHHTDRRAIVRTMLMSALTTAAVLFFAGAVLIYIIRSNRHLRAQVRERRRVEEALRISEARFSSMVNNIPGVTFRCRNDSRRTMEYISPQALALTGYPASDFLFNHLIMFGRIVHDADRDRVTQNVAQALDEGQAWAIDYRIRRRNGDIRWVHERGRGIRDSHGGVRLLEGVILDVTDRVHAEVGLRESRRSFEQLADAMPQVVWAAGPDGRLDYLNRRACDYFGEPDQKVLARGFATRIHPTDAASARRRWRDSRASGEPFETEYRLRRHDGEYRWHLARAEPISDDEGQIIRWFGTCTDIDEFKHVQTELVEQRVRLDLALTSAEMGVWDWDVELDETSWDERLHGLLGMSKATDRCTFEAFKAMILPEDLDRVDQAVRMAMEADTAYVTDYRIRRADGQVRHVATRGQVYRNSLGKVVRMIGLSWDVTDAKQAENELAERLRTEHALFEVASCLQSQAGRADVVRRTLAVLREAAHAGRAYLFENFTDEKDGLCSRQTYEVCGENVPSELGNLELQHVPYEPEFSEWRKTLEHDGSVAGLVSQMPEPIRRVLEPQGIRSIVLVPLRVHGQWEGFMGLDDLASDRAWSDRELTFLRTASEMLGSYLERVNYEREMLAARESAEAANRAKGEFLANMSHEIRTPMNAVMGMAHLMSNTPLTPRQSDYVTKIQVAARSLMGLVNDILDFSKVEAGLLQLESIPFRMDQVLDDVMSILSTRAEQKGLELILEASPETPPTLIGDPLRLGQILLNLAGNAVKFTETGEVVVGVGPRGRREGRVELEFWVKDTGIGMSPDQCKRVFEAFSQGDASMTRRYGGTGLGLTISRRLVEMMGGGIEVESQLGVGSVFRFTIPFVVGQGTRSDLHPEANLRGLKILVVDDNQTSRQTLRAMLEAMTFRVDDVGSAREALNSIRGNGKPSDDPYRLVITDWRMPVMDGIDLVREIDGDGRIDPKPKVILATAYGRQEVFSRAEAAGLSGVLVKPVSMSVLFDAVVQALGGEPRDQPVDVVPVSPAETHPLAGMTLLLVEDNPLNQQVAREILTQAGAEVQVASNGEEAITGLSQSRFHLVLMDAQMPVMDGYEATRRIRENPAYAHMPIIAMTANAMVGDREKSLDAGMNDHLSKPIDPNELIRTIRKWVGETSDLRERAPASSRAPRRSQDSEQPGSPTGQAPELPRIAGVDTRSGMAYVGDKPSLYRVLMTRFVEGYADLVVRLRECLANGEAEEAQRLAHTLKGLAAMLGVTEVATFAEAVEHRLAKTPGKVSDEALAELERALAATITSIREWLAQPEDGVDAEGEPNEPLVAQTVDPGGIVACCRRVRRLLQTHDFDSAIAARELEQAAAATSVAHLAIRIRENAEAFDYDAAARDLTTIENLLHVDSGNKEDT